MDFTAVYTTLSLSMLLGGLLKVGFAVTLLVLLAKIARKNKN